MPRYRIPDDIDERARRELAKVSHKSMAGRALQDLINVRRAEAGMRDGQGIISGSYVWLNFGSRGNRAAPPPCVSCGWMSDRLCDWPVDRPAPKSLHEVPSRTCDAPLCESCTRSPRQGVDVCPTHDLARRARLAARTNSTDGVGP